MVRRVLFGVSGIPLLSAFGLKMDLNGGKYLLLPVFGWKMDLNGGIFRVHTVQAVFEV